MIYILINKNFCGDSKIIKIEFKYMFSHKSIVICTFLIELGQTEEKLKMLSAQVKETKKKHRFVGRKKEQTRKNPKFK